MHTNQLGIAKLTLSEEQQQALDFINTVAEPIFITGGAGVGKSVLLRAFVSQYDSHEIAVAAPTGIAAQNVNGITLHSLFGFPVEGILYYEQYRRSGSEYFKRLKALVIDEVSMVRVDIMHQIDRALRFHRKSEAPFGGLKIVLFGDPFQLPPILRYEDIHTSKDPYGLRWKRHFGSKYFFKAPAIRESGLHVLELESIQRQSTDLEFAKVLNKLRKGFAADSDFEFLTENSAQESPRDEAIRIFGKNDAVNSYNSARLNALDKSTQTTYTATWVRNSEVAGAPLRGHDAGPENPADQQIELRKGARVIFIKNDDQSGTKPGLWANGTLGQVLSASRNEVHVLLDSGVTVKVGRSRFEVRELVKGETSSGKQAIFSDVSGWYDQIPLRLGWAITVHKSQGQTLDKVVLDFDEQYFEAGQAYVALSRVRKLQDIYLITSPEAKNLFKHDYDITVFMNSAKKAPFSYVKKKSASEKKMEIEEIWVAQGFERDQFIPTIARHVASTAEFKDAEDFIDFLYKRHQHDSQNIVILFNLIS